jgi:hypothetical protein
MLYNYCAFIISEVQLGCTNLKERGSWGDVNKLQGGSFGFFVLLSLNFTS